jgi:hypothetical protein
VPERVARRCPRAEQQPADLAVAAVAGADVGVVAVPHDERRCRDPAVLLGDEGTSLRDPRVDDHLAGLALELAENGVDGRRHARDDGRGVAVDERGDLVAVGAAEGTDLHGGHG